MVFSLIVAFIVTPWAALRLLHRGPGGNHGGNHESEDRATRLYRDVMDHLLHKPLWRWSFLIGVAVLLLGACAMVGVGMVRVKMLPFDNKSEFQVIIDMPEDATLETTAAAAQQMGDYLATVNEVTDYQIHVGTSGPFNFNGLVRHYYLRREANHGRHPGQPGGERASQRPEPRHRQTGAAGAVEAIAEIAMAPGSRWRKCPPVPPVLSTLVAEVYGPDYDRQRELAQIMTVFEETPGVVDVDWFMEDEQTRYRLEVDQEKAALHGISVAPDQQHPAPGLEWPPGRLLHQPRKRKTWFVLHRPWPMRAGVKRLKAIKIAGRPTVACPSWSPSGRRQWTAASTTRISCRWST
jgi:multidrug efflux pump subunit AcrB